MHDRKDKVVKKLTYGVQFLVEHKKVDTIFGKAKFVGLHAIEINGKVYQGKNIIIATGSTARSTYWWI